MARLVADVAEILGRARRRQLAALVGLSTVGSIADTVGVALVFLVVRFASDPVAIAGGRWTSRFYALAGTVDPSQAAARLGIAVLALFVLKGIYGAALHYVQCAFCSRGVAELGTRLFRGYLTADFALLRLRHSAELIRNVRELANHVYYEVVMALIGLGVEIVVLAGLTVVLLVLQPLPTIAAGVVLVVLFVGQGATVRRLGAGLGQRYLTAASALQKRIQEGLEGLKETTILGREADAVAAFAAAQQEFTRVVGRQLFLAQVHRFTNEVVVLLAVSVVILFAFSREGGDGRMLAPLAMFAAAAFRMVPAVNRIMYNINIIRHYRPSVGVMLEELRAVEPKEDREDATGGRLPFRRELAFVGVTYRYPDAGRPALSDVTVTIPHGASVGIVGESGAGKSTLADILLGLRTPTRGSVLVDGVDIATARRAWQRNLGYVPRQVYVADDTIRRNVALGVPDLEIDDDRVWKALRVARLQEVVDALPDGIGATLGEHGARLSDGQRQRVGIARALYRDPDVLVFDEATAALDVPSEHDLTETIRELRGHTTLVVIAHRLSTVKECDQILLVDRGTVADVGTLRDLVARNPGFARAVALADLSAYQA